MSEPSPQPGNADASGQANVPDSLLTFKVYTLAELERRSDAPVAMRVSRASFDTTGSRAGTFPAHWSRVTTALKAFAVASIAWFKIKGERPKVKVALRQPFDVLGDELQHAVEAVDWKKLGVTTGIVVGATLTLLFAVLTAAELTDDLKPPGAAAHLASSDPTGIPAKTALDARSVAPATNMVAMGTLSPAAPVIAPAPAGAGAPAVTAIGDIDTPPTPEEAAPTPAKKPVRKAAKPKTNKLTFRNPDAVFHP